MNGTRVLLGSTLPQFTADREVLLDGVMRARSAGLDSVWLFDHMWPLSGGKERPILECWTTLAWVAARTEDILIGTLVTRSSLRHPALLAKMAATVAAVAPGRLTIAIGSGDELSRRENEAFGLPYFEADRRGPQLEATVEVLRAYLMGEPVTSMTAFTSIERLPASPPVAQPPHVWLGGRSGDVLDIAGRLADGWNAWGGGPKRFAQDAAIALDAARGRAFELSWGGVALLAPSDEEAEAKLGRRDPRKYVVGGPEAVARRIGRFVDAGARHIILSFPDAATPGPYELLGERVRKELKI